MKPVTDSEQIEQYSELVREMMLTEEYGECEFNPVWIRSHGWKVVPVESMGRFPEPDIPGLVATFKEAGYKDCFAVATELLGTMPFCYLVSVDEVDFLELNRQLGLFRFVLTSVDRFWAISCAEWYNLFAAEPTFLEALLGKSIGKAREEFLKFAGLLAKDPDDPLLRTANHYANL